MEIVDANLRVFSHSRIPCHILKMQVDFILFKEIVLGIYLHLFVPFNIFWD